MIWGKHHIMPRTLYMCLRVGLGRTKYTCFLRGFLFKCTFVYNPGQLNKCVCASMVRACLHKQKRMQRIKRMYVSQTRTMLLTCTHIHTHTLSFSLSLSHSLSLSLTLSLSLSLQKRNSTCMQMHSISGT